MRSIYLLSRLLSSCSAFLSSSCFITAISSTDDLDLLISPFGTRFILFQLEGFLALSPTPIHPSTLIQGFCELCDPLLHLLEHISLSFCHLLPILDTRTELRWVPWELRSCLFLAVLEGGQNLFTWTPFIWWKDTEWDWILLLIYLEYRLIFLFVLWRLLLIFRGVQVEEVMEWVLRRRCCWQRDTTWYEWIISRGRRSRHLLTFSFSTTSWDQVRWLKLLLLLQVEDLIWFMGFREVREIRIIFCFFQELRKIIFWILWRNW